MSKSKPGSNAHSNVGAMARLNRQARNAARRKLPATSDAGAQPTPNEPCVRPEHATPGLPPDTKTPWPAGGSWDGI
jgi:hypothetical protein